MSRVIGFVVCGFTLAACSASVPGLDFLKSSPAKTALRFESVPPGAVVKVSGQSCRTPCELKLEVAELSATFALKGYQPRPLPCIPRAHQCSLLLGLSPIQSMRIFSRPRHQPTIG